ncbi:MAG: hypothetical protein LKJ88_00680 [Bacilli bacterium]|jgi:M6 family metalloprotease-like protein|nr:hypothetical protein [Bacilli bacterium]
MKKKIIPFLASVALMTLSSCSIDFGFSAIYSVSTTSVATSFTGSREDPFYNGSEYFRKMLINGGMYSAPSTGNVKALVVPVVFKDDQSTYSDTSAKGIELKSKMQTAFFGTANETGYWESLSSYYTKSSYGKLNISGTVTPYLNLDYTVDQALASIPKGKDSASITNTIAEKAYDAFFTNGSYNYKDYDSDNDGIIDLVWLVYCHDYSRSDNTSLLWAYTYWDSSANYSHLANYSWASSSFMDESGVGVDAHTFIHETGHQFGLDDYYSYDNSPSRSPMGGVDMMDNNIVDHCSFSKYCLDWVSPIVGKKDQSYTLKPFESSGDCLILGDNFNGTCFDEYFIAEYYTPTGLNALDTANDYDNAGVYGLSQSGLRILHVDQRLGKFTSKGWDGYLYDNPSTQSHSSYYYWMINSNSKCYCSSSTNYCLVNLVQASGKTNLLETSSGGASSHFANNNDIFTSTSKVFGQDIYGTNQKTNEGWTLPYKVEISSLSSSGLSLTLSTNS